MKRLVLLAAALVCALLLVAGCGSTSSSNTEAQAVAAAKAYVQSIGRQNSLAIDGIQVLAVRVNGAQAIVRVEVTYHPYLAIPGQKPLKGPEATVTLAAHLYSGAWYPEYGAVQ